MFKMTFILEYIFRFLFSVLVITNMTGNIFVILIIVKNRSMKTPINYLLLNLAVADLMVGVFVVPRHILDGTFTHPRGLSGNVLCKFITTGNLTWVSTVTSAYSLVFIAFERYYAIMKPLSIRHRITIRKLKIFIPICWTLAVIYMTSTFYFEYFDEKLRVCRYAWPEWVLKLNMLSWLLLLGIIPTIIMTTLYSRVIYRLWFTCDGDNNTTLQGVIRSRKKITKTMLVLSAIFVFCWFPDTLMHFFEDFFPSYVSYAELLKDAFHLLIVLNSTVNPIIYGFQFDNFRKGLRALLCCKRDNRIQISRRNSKHDIKENRVGVELEMKTNEILPVVSCH